MKQNYHIDGMSCASCASRVEQAALKVPSVKEASVNLATDTLRVTSDNELDPTNIIESVQQAGYQANLILSPQEQFERDERQKEAKRIMQKKQLYWMFLFAIPLFIIAMGPMLGIPLPHIIDPVSSPLGNALVQFILTVPILYFGRDIFIRGFRQLIHKQPSMDSLVALGTSAAFIQGIIATIYWVISPTSTTGHHPIELYFESAGVIITLMTLGRYLEELAKGQTAQAIRELMNLTPPTARVIDDNGNVTLKPVDEVQIDDLIQIQPGESLPVDGIITQGRSAIDESMITGESMPVAKEIGDTVIGASVNSTGAFTYRATRVGQDTMISQIIRMVQEAQGSKAPISNLADRVAHYFVPTVIILAILAGVFWGLVMGESLNFTLRIVISVLVIACPCALGLATPTSIMVGTGNGAKHGILVRSGESLEKMHHTTTVVLDKTGTVTMGSPTLTDWLVDSEQDEAQVMQLIYNAEKQSEHPLALAITRYGQEQNFETLPVESFNSITGKGIEAQIADQTIQVGNQAWIESMSSIPNHLIQQAIQWANEGKTPIFAAVNQRAVATIAISDPVKDSSEEAIQQMIAEGLKVVLLTGDNKATAEAIAKQVGIEQVYSQVLPQDKAQIVKQLQTNRECVMMVGDGINDAPALAQADIGLAVSSGTDVAISSADVILMHNDLKDVLRAIHLSKLTLKNIKQNLFWAFAYNIIGIPIAMGVLKLFFDGPLLNPMMAALAMSLSSISVLTNALRLRYQRLL